MSDLATVDPREVVAAAVAALLSENQPASVYRIYADGTLLYVGMTTNLDRRLAEHRHNKWWFEWSDDVDVAAYPDVTIARLVETSAIRDESPLFNVHRPSHCTPSLSGNMARQEARRQLEAKVAAGEYQRVHDDNGPLRYVRSAA